MRQWFCIWLLAAALVPSPAVANPPTPTAVNAASDSRAAANAARDKDAGRKQLTANLVIAPPGLALRPIALLPFAASGRPADNFTFRDDPCDGALFTSGALDGVDAYSSERGGLFNVDSWTADDADLPDSSIGGIHWYAAVSSDYRDDGVIDAQVLSDDSGRPGASVTAFTDEIACRFDTGEILFGQSLIQYTFRPPGGLKLSADRYWFALRPVSQSGAGRAFWATSPLTDADAHFYSPFFGYTDWVRWSDIVGVPSNVSFCLTQLTDPGACCLGGDCFETTSSDCVSKGGVYQGDRISCCSVACPGRPAACCFDDGTCENLKPLDCSDSGGIYNESRRCGAGACPLPDFCEEALYSQFGYDGFSGVANQDSQSIDWIDAWTSDDFSTNRRAEITGLVIQTAVTGNPDVQLGDYFIAYASKSGGPAAIVVAADDAAYRTRITDGTTIFGGQIYVTVFDIPAARIVPGQYFIGAREQFDSPEQAFLLTGIGAGSEAYFRSNFYGYQRWTSTKNIFGNGLDFSFCVLGGIRNDRFGACCTNNDTNCEILSPAQCSSAGGKYGGDSTTCFPNPCAKAPGACCFSDGSCTVLSPTECTKQGGAFKGGDVECAPGLCPLPGFCDDSLYSQFGFNGLNGLSNQDSAAIDFIESWTAEDAILSSRVVVERIVVQVTVRQDPTVDLIDYFLANARPNCAGPATNIVSADDVPYAFRLTDGTPLFGGTVYAIGADLPPTRLLPGAYYIGLREVINERVQSYLLSANGGNCESYFQSQYLNYPRFVPVEDVIGESLEFSFCLLGSVSGESFGGCCIDNQTHCILRTRSECTSDGGKYLGDDAECYPSPCINAVGACCRDDGTCEQRTASDCDEVGGVFEGGETDCTPGVCPLPNPCDGATEPVLYDNFIPDRVDALSSENSSSAGYIESWTADDFTLSARAVIRDWHWWTLDSPNIELDGTVEYLFLADRDGSPGPIAATGTAPYERVISGESLFGYDIVLNNIWQEADVRVPLTAGTYWFAVRPIILTQTRSFWMTAPNAGASAHLKSIYFGYRDWVSWGALSGIPTDTAFCLTGDDAPAAFGACCLDDASICSLLSSSQCSAAGGAYLGNDVSCTPNPCSNARGACCASDGACTFVSAATCDADGGEFQGGDITCDDIVCPLPDPCDGSTGEVLFNNSGYDEANALTSQDSSSVGYIVSYTADDVVFEAPVTIGGLHWFDAINNTLHDNSDGTADYIILTDGDDRPAVQIGGKDDIPNRRRRTGEALFGVLPIYLNDLTVDVSLSAGHFWIGVRPNVIERSQSWWVTAPLTNAEAHLKSVYFGYPEWTGWSASLGYRTDVALCVTGPSESCTNIHRADSDGSGIVDFNDIDCFVAALISRDDWESCGTAFTGELQYVCANDADGTGTVDFNDIDSFIQCIIDGGCD